ncbi:hypothetical protein CP500_003850 [Tychonema bourrellyi FEM_GT703]|uniref:Uncharacterized protein n=1 Tax=Tychonema bourrellyi FEM_GT703 TaxID=2040638 RepID=A0A2G4F4P6_9CYAN|nr:hypothetical protein CP500_003850 [Tychonema bourrellyi FEM_GT703]
MLVASGDSIFFEKTALNVLIYINRKIVDQINAALSYIEENCAQIETEYCRVRQPTAFTLAFGAIKLTHPTGL